MKNIFSLLLAATFTVVLSGCGGGGGGEASIANEDLSEIERYEALIEADQQAEAEAMKGTDDLTEESGAGAATSE